jgi:hypothetical protein
VQREPRSIKHLNSDLYPWNRIDSTVSIDIKKQTALAKMTSQTMSMFTVVTVFFLPLEFFSSVSPSRDFFTSLC